MSAAWTRKREEERDVQREGVAKTVASVTRRGRWRTSPGKIENIRGERERRREGERGRE